MNDEALSMIREEERLLEQVLTSLKAQRARDVSRFAVENERARALTSAIVGTRREEDKAMLASDEAVSHGLSAQKKRDITTIDAILKNPYFGRIVLEEELGDELRSIEYKIGFSSNTDCRIIDWRKAPLAKLYYEYKEGDDYSEEIQGRERVGRVALRNTLEIRNAELQRLSCRHGSFAKHGSEWRSGSERRAKRNADGSLPEILSLITAEQFRMITEEATTAILIQGIAGSGKTTVALHRLAWLLHSDNSDLRPEECVVVVLSNVLKRYVASMLPSMEVHGVRVLTLAEFAAETVGNLLPELRHEDGGLRRPADPTPRSITRVKSSLGVLRCLEQYAAEHYREGASWRGYQHDLISVLSQYPAILAHDDSGLLDRELILQALQRTERNLAEQLLDPADDALLLRLAQLRTGGVTLPDGATGGRYRHIVADEVQDLSPVDLAGIIGAVKDAHGLTLVGDSSQRLDGVRGFPGWEKLRELWSLKESTSKYLSLTVSHRSTLPIMRLADHIQERSLVTQGRMGRVPIWFRCGSEPLGLRSARDWLSKAMERYPSQITAVICADMHEAKLALSLLSPTLGATVRLGDASSFSFEEGIVVTAVKEVKGLEFTNVLLWNPSAKSYPVAPESKNALYVAVTRAEENLCIVTWSKPTALLPSFGSPLIRPVRIEEEPEEEQEPLPRYENE